MTSDVAFADCSDCIESERRAAATRGTTVTCACGAEFYAETMPSESLSHGVPEPERSRIDKRKAPRPDRPLERPVEPLDVDLDLPPPQRSRIARRPRIVKPPRDHRVDRFVRELLWYGVQRERVERAAGMSQSATASAIARVELYTIGSDGARIKGEYRGKVRGAYLGPGCKGTKGVMASHEDPAPIHVDAIAQARYDALGTEARETAEAIIEDGAGFAEMPRQFGRYTFDFTLPQRIGWRFAPYEKVFGKVDEHGRGGWTGKLADGDSAPALAAARIIGTARLEGAAGAWWGMRSTET